MTRPIAEEFAAIHARLREIEAASRPVPAAATPAPATAVAAQYADFYGWLTAGVLQAPAGSGQGSGQGTG